MLKCLLTSSFGCIILWCVGFAWLLRMFVFKYFYVGVNMRVFPLFGFGVVCSIWPTKESGRGVILFVCVVHFVYIVSFLSCFKCICVTSSKVSYFSQQYTHMQEKT
jgi:hypothetical protein